MALEILGFGSSSLHVRPIGTADAGSVSCGVAGARFSGAAQFGTIVLRTLARPESTLKVLVVVYVEGLTRGGARSSHQRPAFLVDEA